MHAGTGTPAAATGGLQTCRVAARRLRRRAAESPLQHLVRHARALHSHRARTSLSARERAAESATDPGRLTITPIVLEDSSPPQCQPACPCARRHRCSNEAAMAGHWHRRRLLVNGQDLQMRRRWGRARPQATTAYRLDRASALLAMRMVSRTAASALSARSQRSCWCSRRVRRCELARGPLRGPMLRCGARRLRMGALERYNTPLSHSYGAFFDRVRSKPDVSTP